MHGVEWGKIRRLLQRITYHYFPEPSPAEPPKARTSGSSSRRSSELKSVVFQSLDLTPGAGNLLGESYWELISPWRGDALTLNTGVSPREEKESSLSQILQDDPPDKYYLTRKACLGILRRAFERGKEMPRKPAWVSCAGPLSEEKSSPRSSNGRWKSNLESLHRTATPPSWKRTISTRGMKVSTCTECPAP